jgi:hypothetical protein
MAAHIRVMCTAIFRAPDPGPAREITGYTGLDPPAEFYLASQSYR